jgi:hypothetical protein
MATKSISLDRIGTLSDGRLEFTILKDGSPWTLDSVTLVFYSPSRVTFFSRGMTWDSVNSVWFYDIQDDELTEEGVWSIRVTVVDGSVQKRYPYEVALPVAEYP